MPLGKVRAKMGEASDADDWRGVLRWKGRMEDLLEGPRTSPPSISIEQEGRCKAIWKREFKLPWREAGPPNHHDDKVGSDQ